MVMCANCELRLAVNGMVDDSIRSRMSLQGGPARGASVAGDVGAEGRDDAAVVAGSSTRWQALGRSVAAEEVRRLEVLVSSARPWALGADRSVRLGQLATLPERSCVETSL
jgi:hypothetical protein